MKLRIRGDSIRLRLTRTEVRTLQQTGTVEETTRFDSSVFAYRLLACREAREITAAFDGHAISVKIPFALAQEWAGSEQVALKGARVLSENASPGPSILIEKDFFCLKPRTSDQEDESDMFPNPNETHGSCGSAS